MTNRHWFYLGAIIIIGGLLVVGAANSNLLRRQRLALENQRIVKQKEQFSGYLAKQTDGQKLVRLAKQMKNSDPVILDLIIDRAYELEPADRDIVVLSSYYHPELKNKILELDPLYKTE